MALYTSGGKIIASGGKPLDSGNDEPCRQWRRPYKVDCNVKIGEETWIPDGDAVKVKSCKFAHGDEFHIEEDGCNGVGYGPKHDCVDVPGASDNHGPPPGYVSTEVRELCCPVYSHCLYTLSATYVCTQDDEHWEDKNGDRITDWTTLPFTVQCVADADLLQYLGTFGYWNRSPSDDCKLIYREMGDPCRDVAYDCGNRTFDSRSPPDDTNIVYQDADIVYPLTLAAFQATCCCGNCVTFRIEPNWDGWECGAPGPCWQYSVDGGTHLPCVRTDYIHEFCVDLRVGVDHWFSFPPMIRYREIYASSFNLSRILTLPGYVSVVVHGGNDTKYNGNNVACEDHQWVLNPASGYPAFGTDSGSMFILTVTKKTCPC
jgi:hypothetical protein